MPESPAQPATGPDADPGLGASPAESSARRPAGRPIISIRSLSKRFGQTVAVDSVSFDVRENEFFALLGPSGCGKTTLLRMIAGLEVPSDGDLLIDGQDVARIPPNRRPTNMVFQSYAVFPHMTVAQNVGYGLKVTGVPTDEIARRVREALEMVRLDTFGERRPEALSGGQRQRVALARALVKRPRVLLLDEPLSALDAKLREQMQFELGRLQKAVGITFVIVTHDQSEALSMADRIAVMNAGRVAQLASPADLYDRPASRFVADFIGKINLLEATVVGQADGTTTVELAGGLRLHAPGAEPPGSTVSLAVRPEYVRLTESRPADTGGALSGRIVDRAFYGDSSHVFVQTPQGHRIGVTLRHENLARLDALRASDEVWVHWPAERAMLLKD